MRQGFSCTGIIFNKLTTLPGNLTTPFSLPMFLSLPPLLPLLYFTISLNGNFCHAGGSSEINRFPKAIIGTAQTKHQILATQPAAADNIAVGTTSARLELRAFLLMQNGGGGPPVLGRSFVVYRREEQGRAKHRQLLNRCTQEEATAASGSK